eukprot:Nitzschia sp. Nitz4//scaffold25_size161228//56566//58330//NITZ4_002423-RA/size161228-augustus-gene-0.111-mRNA-1//1//CDS//3329544565//7363//frame0
MKYTIFQERQPQNKGLKEDKTPVPTAAPVDTSVALATSTLMVGDTEVALTATEADDSEVTVEIKDVGMLTVTPSGYKLILSATESGFEPTIEQVFPDAVVLTEELALQLATFLTLQLAAAVDEANPESERHSRRLDNTGCDLFPDAPCDLGCCAVHDECYAKHGCNIDGSELCYDNKCNLFYECEGDCPFFSLDDSKCCGCKVPGEDCYSPLTCGDGECNYGENLSNCFVDCAYNQCPEDHELLCSGTCVNPNSSPDNCGACDITCPTGADCVLGKCSLPFSISWSQTTSGGGAWLISNGGKTIRFDIEDSANCGCPNGNVQSGVATAEIHVSEAYGLTTEIIGIAELEDANFENMNIYVDGTLVLTSTSTDLDLGCSMGPVVVTVLEPQPVVLTPGDHTFELEFTTNDSLFHVNAFYELNLIFVPMSLYDGGA